MAALKAENVALKKENLALRSATNADTGQASPPPKRRAPSASSNEDSLPAEAVQDNRFERLERALADQKAEYTQITQTLLSTQAAMQASIEAMRLQMHDCIRNLMAQVNPSAAPVFDITDDENLS